MPEYLWMVLWTALKIFFVVKMIGYFIWSAFLALNLNTGYPYPPRWYEYLKWFAFGPLIVSADRFGVISIYQRYRQWLVTPRHQARQ